MNIAMESTSASYSKSKREDDGIVVADVWGQLVVNRWRVLVYSSWTWKDHGIWQNPTKSKSHLRQWAPLGPNRSDNHRMTSQLLYINVNVGLVLTDRNRAGIFLQPHTFFRSISPISSISFGCHVGNLGDPPIQLLIFGFMLATASILPPFVLYIYIIIYNYMYIYICFPIKDDHNCG